MYVDYDTYLDNVYADTMIGEELYSRLSSTADCVIDEWTIGRVGNSVAKSVELPASVVNLYCAIVSNVRKVASGISDGSASDDRLSSFSNGVDSFGFDTTTSEFSRMYESLEWLIDLLPVEYCSRGVFEWRRRYHAC